MRARVRMRVRVRVRVRVKVRVGASTPNPNPNPNPSLRRQRGHVVLLDVECLQRRESLHLLGGQLRDAIRRQVEVLQRDHRAEGGKCGSQPVLTEVEHLDRRGTVVEA